jgi:hypothetical protein
MTYGGGYLATPNTGLLGSAPAGSDTVDGDTRVPHNASVISSTRRTETPARYISISASSTNVSRRL